MRKNKLGETTIIAGEYGGRKIRTPGEGTHPMGLRERMALFNMIQEWVPGAFVLDAFAGSGALGIEAISRGADFVLFIDKDPRAVDAINENMARLGISQAEHGGALRKDILEEAPMATDRFLIVFADPPYDEYQPEMIREVSRLVAPGGILVASTPEPAPEIEGMIKWKERRYARAHITVYRRGLAV